MEPSGTVARGQALGDVVCKPFTHVVNQHVGIRMRRDILKGRSLALPGSNHRRSVTGEAADPWLIHVRPTFVVLF